MKLIARAIINGLLAPTPYRIYRKGSAEVFRNAFADQATLVGNKEDSTIFDVGAHQGLISDRFLNVFPRATVHAFEPFPPVFEKLKERAQSKPGLIPHCVAVSDKNGKATLHCNAFDPTNSLFPTHVEAAEHWGKQLLQEEKTIQISTRTLDSFCEDGDIGRINILKLDVQGAELMVLRGAERLLKAGLVDVIYTELIIVPTYQGQSAYYRVMAYLEELGYALFNLYNPCYHNGLILQYDGIFISPRVRVRLKV